MRRIAFIQLIFLLTILTLMTVVGYMIPRGPRMVWDVIAGLLGGMLFGIAVIFGRDYVRNRHEKQGAPFRSLVILATISAIVGFLIALGSAIDLVQGPHVPGKWFFVPVIAFWCWIATCHWFGVYGMHKKH